jgi:hypothetical protein
MMKGKWEDNYITNYNPYDQYQAHPLKPGDIMWLKKGELKKMAARSEQLTHGQTCKCITCGRKWETIEEKEVDPNGVGQHDPGAKCDKGKPDASLLGMFGKALLEVAKVGTYGAKKYTRGGWESVSDGINRYTAAMLRHYFTERYETYDTDIPVLHAAQVAWNALARLELILREKDEKE